MNIFNVLSCGDSSLREPAMSAMLGYLLDSNADHGLGDTFAKAFLQELDNKRFKDFFDEEFISYRVALEEEYELNGKRKNIDIQVSIFNKEEEIHRLIIENKIKTSSANEKQLKEYHQAVINNSDIAEDKITFIFLTPKHNSTRLDKEFQNLDDANVQKYWIYWEANQKSITHVIKKILFSEALGEIEPINEYVRHTLKAFRKYCIDELGRSSTRKMRRGDLGKIIAEEVIQGEKTYKIVLRDSGQVQAFEQHPETEEEKVPARPILIAFINEIPELKSRFNHKDIGKFYNTRTIGKKFFQWRNEQRG